MHSSVSAADIPSSRGTQWLLAVAMMACMMLFTLHWPAIVDIGGTSLQPYHFGALLLLVATALPFWIHLRVLHTTPWILAYTFHLVLLAPALAGTNRLSMLNRQVFFVAVFFAVVAFCLRSRAPATILRRGSLCGIAVFFLMVEYSAQQMGKSLTTAVTSFLASGNLKVLMAQFFRPVFNALAPPGEMLVSSALTNTVGGGLLILALCFRASFQRERRDLLGSVVMLLVVAFLLFMNARSTVMAALVGIVLTAVLRVIRQRGVNLNDLMFWGITTALATGFIYLATLYGRSVIDTVVTAFSFNDDSTEGRLNQFFWAAALIDASPIGGSGYMPTPSGRAIHNLFLSAWAYGGLFNFLLILAFYAGILWTWGRWLHVVVSRPDYWSLNLRVEWVAALPVLPLFRVWLSGDAGHLPFSEWVALGVFVGLVIRNDLRASLTAPAPTLRREGFEAAA